MLDSTYSHQSRLPALLLDRYLAGEATEAESAEVDAWISQHSDGREVLEAFLATGAAKRMAALGADTERRWAIVLARIQELRDERRHSTPEHPRRRQVDAYRPAIKRPSRFGVSRPFGFAYVFVALVFCAVAVTMTRSGPWRPFVSHVPARVSTYSTTNGQRATITLLDGTVASLDVGSLLEVPADYASGNRKVHLVGAALFTVAHHEGAPFTVQTGQLTARVLGTTFMARHYPTDTIAQVAVLEGKVAVNRQIVAAAQMIEVNPLGVARIRPAGQSPFMFATGVMALGRMPLTDAIPELNRWYDGDIRLGDPALGLRMVEGRFPAGSLSDLKEVLEWTFNVRVVRDGKVLTLFPKANR